MSKPSEIKERQRVRKWSSGRFLPGQTIGSRLSSKGICPDSRSRCTDVRNKVPRGEFACSIFPLWNGATNATKRARKPRTSCTLNGFTTQNARGWYWFLYFQSIPVLVPTYKPWCWSRGRTLFFLGSGTKCHKPWNKISLLHAGPIRLALSRN